MARGDWGIGHAHAVDQISGVVRVVSVQGAREMYRPHTMKSLDMIRLHALAADNLGVLGLTYLLAAF